MKRSGLHPYGDIPDEVRKRLDFDQSRLYELIWKRAIASQMADAQLDQTAADISGITDHLTMRATRFSYSF